MDLIDLTPDVRTAMLAEYQADADADRLYKSDRLTPAGRGMFPALLREAIAGHDPAWLAARLRGLFNATEGYVRNGKHFTREVPENANEQLAESEFNRFYCRGLCSAVCASDPVGVVEVYRAKEVAHARTESRRLIGTRVSAAVLLADLRASIGVDTALGVPAGPNSGISIRRPVPARDMAPDTLPAV